VLQVQLEDTGAGPVRSSIAAQAWQAALFLGVVTLILGVIVAAYPTTSLAVIAVLIGVLMIISGLVHIIRVFDSSEQHRVWLGIAGLLFIVAGVVLVRHLHLSLALIGLIVGITWIVQGMSALVGGFSGEVHEGRGWWIFFGVISLIAGIVVVSSPLASVTTLAVLVGIWFVVMGLMEIIGAFMLRRAIPTSGANATSVPPARQPADRNQADRAERLG
jgi:uncharacterized membrane protein HdeD (DUF308 family)